MLHCSSNLVCLLLGMVRLCCRYIEGQCEGNGDCVGIVHGGWRLEEGYVERTSCVVWVGGARLWSPHGHGKSCFAFGIYDGGYCCSESFGVG